MFASVFPESAQLLSSGTVYRRQTSSECCKKACDCETACWDLVGLCESFYKKTCTTQPVADLVLHQPAPHGETKYG